MDKGKLTQLNQPLDMSSSKLIYHLDRIQKWQKGEYFPPVQVEINPTEICNHRCPFCYSDFLGCQEISIPEDRLIRLFAELPAAGVLSCQIQGTGEPLVNKGLPDAIVNGSENGLDIALCTNGSLLTRDILKQILPSLSFLRLTNLEYNAALYAKTHGCPESHLDRVVTALKTAVTIRNQENYKTVIGSQIMLFYYNAPYLEETVRMLKDIGIDYVHIKPAAQDKRTDGYSWERDVHLQFKDKLLAVKGLSDNGFLVNIAWKLFEMYQVKQDFNEYKICYGCEFYPVIDADCKIYPCEELWRNEEYCLGDISNQTFEEAWKSKERIEAFKRFYDKIRTRKCCYGSPQDKMNGFLFNLKNPPRNPNFL